MRKHRRMAYSGSLEVYAHDHFLQLISGELLDLAIADAAMWTCTYDIRFLHITATISILLEHGIFMCFMTFPLSLSGVMVNRGR